MISLSKNFACGVSATVDGDNFSEVFEKLAQIEDCFRTPDNVKEFIMRVRKDKEDNKYFELREPKTRATLSLGQHKKGGMLFPKRKDKNDNWLDDLGWVVWEGKQKPATTKVTGKTKSKSESSDDDVPFGD